MRLDSMRHNVDGGNKIVSIQNDCNFASFRRTKLILKVHFVLKCRFGNGNVLCYIRFVTHN
jgi:hypothetical protein